jgi:ankyrin repeat protein
MIDASSTDKTDALLMGESSTTGELDLNVSPAHFINTILKQSNGRIAKLCGDDNIFAVASRNICQESYFITLTEDQQLAYNNEKVGAVQNNDVDALRVQFHSGEIMQTSNRFGESLLHTACRRGFTEMVHFFLFEAGVCPRVRDDMGRTPMHDACWSSCAPNHDLMKMLIGAAPEMLLSRDSRGHSPFDYARREHWPNWVSFLNENRQFIVNSFLSTCVDGESVSTQSQTTCEDDCY